MHDYTLERIVPDSQYYWVIFCRRCGHVAFFGNAREASINDMQARLPRQCYQGDAAQSEKGANHGN